MWNRALVASSLRRVTAKAWQRVAAIFKQRGGRRERVYEVRLNFRSIQDKNK